MKKVIAIFAVLALTASVSFAQNNTAEVKQEGNDLKTEVTQTGEKGNVNVDQYSTAPPSRNMEVFVMQAGLRNNTEIKQRDNQPPSQDATSQIFVDQAGYRNDIYIHQNGWNNLIDAYQGANTSRNYIQIARESDLGPTQGGASNEILARQEGNTERSNIFMQQKDRRSNAIAIQRDQSRSNIYTYQRNGHPSSLVSVFQNNGERNLVDVSAIGRGYHLEIEQLNGSRNEAFVEQKDFGGGINDDNGGFSTLLLRQEGDKNYFGEGNPSPFIQEGKGHKVAGLDWGDPLAFNENKWARQIDGATFTGYQNGTDHTIGLYQKGTDGRVTGHITQEGIGHTALLWQQGGVQNSIIEQNGNNNFSSVRQY